VGINTRDRGRFSTGGIFHVRGGSVGFGTSVADGGKGDVIMYRKAVGELALADSASLTVPGSATVAGALKCDGAVALSAAVTSTGAHAFGAGGTTITFSTGSGGTVTWAKDVNLYWGAAGQLKTDDTLDATTGGIRTKLAAGNITVAALANTGDVQLQFCGGTARLIANVSGTVHFVNLTVKP